MGVKGLWGLFEGCSREVPIESLHGKRLAIDASIWMYQFIKAMRGSDVKGAHILGFYQRICKLLYFGIQPVFVFDGTPPALKKATLARRKVVRVDAGETVKRTAAKLLETRMKIAAIDQFDNQAKVNASVPASNARKTDDQYAIHAAMKEMMFPEDDERLATEDDLRQFITDHINTSNIDMDSSVFAALPPTLQHELILSQKQHSRHPSHLHRHSLLESQSSLEFSKQQIMGLCHRNKMSERLYDFTKSVGVVKAVAEKGEFSGRIEVSRVAAQRNRQYILVKNDDEGDGKTGWKMRIHESTNAPIKVEKGDEIDGRKRGEERRVQFDEDVARAIQASLDATFAGDEMQETSEDDDMNRAVEMSLKSNPADEVILISSDSEEFELVSVPEAADPLIKTRDLIELSDKDEELKFDIELSVQSQAVALNAASSESESEEFEEVEVPVQQADFFYSDTLEPSDDSAPFDASSMPIDEPVAASVSQIANAIPKHIDPAYTLTNSNDTFTHSFESEDELPLFEHEDRQAGIHSYAEPKSIKTELKPIDEKMHSQKIGARLIQAVIPEQFDLTFPDDSQEYPVDSSNAAETSSFKQTVEQAHQKHVDSMIIDFASTDSGEVSNLAPLTVEPSIFDKINELSDVERDNYDTFFSSITASNARIIRDQLLSERDTLTESKRKETRNASGISSDMIVEIQELLHLFGLPYISAPSEAEAQCAFLQINKLVDGIVTDDSDVFLFGGTKIYRHMFNQNKNVMLIEPDTVHGRESAQRDDYIKLAYLLGSDYTEGVYGIGLIKAVDIVQAWPGVKLQGLAEFKVWCLNEQEFMPVEQEGETPLQAKYRKLGKKLEFPHKFPDPKIYDCYANPEVDEDVGEFKWGQIDLDGVRDFLECKIGWGKSKVDDVLLPVIKQMRKNAEATKGLVQRSIDQYFKQTTKRSGDTLESWGMSRKASAAKMAKTATDRARSK